MKSKSSDRRHHHRSAPNKEHGTAVEKASSFARYTDHDSTRTPSIGKVIAVRHKSKIPTPSSKSRQRRGTETDGTTRGRREQQSPSCNSGRSSSRVHDDASGEYLHQKSFRVGKMHRGLREPSGLRISQVMESRQDHHDGDRIDIEAAADLECHRDGAAAPTTSDTDGSESSWEMKSVSSSISNSRSTCSRKTSVSNSRSTTVSPRHGELGSSISSRRSSPSTSTHQSSSIPLNIQSSPKISNGRSRSKSDCNATTHSRMTRHTSATPKVSNLNNKVSHLNIKTIELEPLSEHDDQNEEPLQERTAKKPFKSRLIGRGSKDNNKEQHHERGNKPPLPSLTPKSHVAIDESGGNNIIIASSYNLKTFDTGSHNSNSKKSSSLKKFLKRTNTNVSSITGWTKEVDVKEESRDEVDYGIDPARGSFDIIVPKRTDSTGSDGRSGGRDAGSRERRNKSKTRTESENRREISAAEAASVASTSIASKHSNTNTNNALLSNLTYWSSLSVKAALAVMQSNTSKKGSEIMAQRAANAVLEAGKQKPPMDLRRLATKVSVVVLEAGGDHKVAAAVAVAIMNVEGKSNNGGKKSKSKSKGGRHYSMETINGSGSNASDGSDRYSYTNDDVETQDTDNIPLRKIASITVESVDYQTADGYKSSQSSTTLTSINDGGSTAVSRWSKNSVGSRSSTPIREDWLVSENNKADGGHGGNRGGIPGGIGGSLMDVHPRSDTTSMKSKRHHLEEREAEIERRNRQLEEATRRNAQKERELQERMETLERAANEKEKKAQHADGGRRAAAERAAKKAAKERAAKDEARRRTEEKERAAKNEARRKAEEKAAKEKAERATRDEAKRKDLKKKEEEIARKKKELEERAHQIALQAEKERRNKKREEEIARSKALEERARAIAAKAQAVAHFSSPQHNDDDVNTEVILQDNQDLASVTISMASKRRHLQEKEAEILARHHALEEATRLNQQNEAEIHKRMAALDAATKTVETKVHKVHLANVRETATAKSKAEMRERKLREKEDMNRRELQKMEYQIAERNRELEEASILNHENELEIRGRMDALDAATASLLERAENVQQEIDQRRNVDHRGRSGDNLPPLTNNNRHHHHHHGTNGEFSVATPGTRNSYERMQHDQSLGQPSDFPPFKDYTKPSSSGQHLPPSALKQSQSRGGMFEQLTGKLYSILDVACDSSVWHNSKSMASPRGTLGEATRGGTIAGEESYNPLEQMGTIDDGTYYTQDDDGDNHDLVDDGGDTYNNNELHRRQGPLEPPRFKSPTLSGLTMDEQRPRGRWFDTRNNNHNTAAAQQQQQQQAQQQQAQHSSPNELLNQALNQAMNQQNNGNNGQNVNPNNNPMTANQALNHALNQAMNQVSTHGDTTQGDTKQLAYKSMIEGGKIKQPSNNGAVAPKANGPKSSLTKLKSTWFSSFKKTTSPTSSGNKKQTTKQQQPPPPAKSMVRMRSGDRIRRGGGHAVPPSGNAAPANNKGSIPLKRVTSVGKKGKANEATFSSPNTEKKKPTSPENKKQLFSFSRKRSKRVEV